ncbi:MAG: amino acid permease [Acidobacteria bacterium]|nr:MAG: amino acid permease [Acidobacteriota bacterium]
MGTRSTGRLGFAPDSAPHLRCPHEHYGNLYSSLLDYVIFAVMLFYALTVIGLFILRFKRPQADRPYRAFGYPVVPALYVVLALLIAADLLIAEKTRGNTIPGLVIVLTGLPVYLLWRRKGRAKPRA